MTLLAQLWRDESGTSTVEYALLTAVLVGGGAAAWVALKDCIAAAITNIAAGFAQPGG